MGALILLGIVFALCIFGMLAVRFGVDTRVKMVDPRYPTDRPGLS